MKKLFSIVVSIAAIGLSISTASAQTESWSVHTGDKPGKGSFFGPNVTTLIVSNLISITNLSVPGITSPTNAPGVTWTNKAGTRVVSSGSNTVNLLGSVPLWSRAHGQPAFTSFSTNQAVTQWPIVGDGNISITTQTGSGADTAMTLIFAPSWDGENVDTSGTYDFTWSTGNLTVSSTQTLATNAPFGKWVGAKALVLKSISYADTTAASQVAVRALRLNGFGPP